jgi:hypothetical protein
MLHFFPPLTQLYYRNDCNFTVTVPSDTRSHCSRALIPWPCSRMAVSSTAVTVYGMVASPKPYKSVIVDVHVLQAHLPVLECHLQRVEENKHFEHFTVLQDALDDSIRHQVRCRQVREVGYLCESGPGSPICNLPVADVEMSNPREKRVAASNGSGHGKIGCSPWRMQDKHCSGVVFSRDVPANTRQHIQAMSMTCGHLGRRSAITSLWRKSTKKTWRVWAHNATGLNVANFATVRRRRRENPG